MPSLAADCIPHICQLQCLPHHASGVQQAARSSHRPEPTGPLACQRATLLFVLCKCSAAQPLASDSFRETRLAVQVFCAVADAQEKLGFRHWDLRLANVMQHTPLQRVGNISEAAVEADSAKPESAAQPELQYKVIDFGHGNLYDRQLKRRDRKASWWLPGFCSTPDLHWLCGRAAVEQGDSRRVIVRAASASLGSCMGLVWHHVALRLAPGGQVLQHAGTAKQSWGASRSRRPATGCSGGMRVMCSASSCPCRTSWMAASGTAAMLS